MGKFTQQTMQDAATATGDGIALNVALAAGAAFQVTGTFVGTVTFEAVVDESEDIWTSLRVTNKATGEADATTTAPGVFSTGVSGVLKVQARISAYTSGEITVAGVGTEEAGSEATGAVGVGTQDVNVAQIVGTATNVGGGIVDAGTQTITLADDDPAVVLLGTIDADTSRIPALGSAGDAASSPVTQSTEDKAVLAAMSAKLPAALGSLADAASLAVTMSTEDKAKVPALGSVADASSSPVTQSTEDKAVLAAMSAKLPAALGSLADAASLAVTQSTEDKAVLAAMSAKLPAALGSLADAASLAVTQSTEDKAVLAAMEALQIERYLELHELDGSDAGNWSAGTDVANIESAADHIPHESKTTCIEMDKTGGTQTEAIMSRVLASVDGSAFMGPTVVEWAVKHADYTNVANVILRLGTDASNYHEYLIDPENFEVGVWQRIETSTWNADSQVGTGLAANNIDYIALGVEMDAAGNTIADVQFEEVRMVSAPLATTAPAAITTEIGGTVRVTKVGTNAGGNWPKDAGAATNGTPRVVIATDDINLAAIAASLALADGNGRTFSTVLIDAAAVMTLGAGGSSKIWKLHELVLFGAAATTVTIGYDDDGAATNNVDKTGSMSIAATGGAVVPYRADPRGCITTVANKFLVLTPTAQVDGWAVVSTD